MILSVAAAHAEVCASRDRGVAAALLTRAEEIVAGNGHDSAWLAVVVGSA